MEDKKDRREFIKLAGTALLVTSGISVIGLVSAKPKDEGEENQEVYFSDGYYDDGYYDDGYSTGLRSDNQGKDNFKLTALPNPSNGNFELVINAKTPEMSEIFIHDLSGKTIVRQSYTLQQGVNLIPFRSGSFVQGIYELTVVTGKATGRLRLVIVK